jgi:transposase
MSQYKPLVRELTEKEFEEFVKPFLPAKINGANVKTPLGRIYNYIAKVLRTGMQWNELQDCIGKDATGKAEIHYTTVFRRFSQWSAYRVFHKSHQTILAAVYHANQLDLSILNGDGTNSIAKKGAIVGAIRDTNTKRGPNVSE